MSFAFMPFFTGDYYRDTRHLSMLQHGAYRQLLDHCWDQKGPLPIDLEKCYRICGAVSKEEQECVRGIVGEFFTQMDDGHYNKRMCEEVRKAEAISTTRAEAGRAGGLAKAAAQDRALKSKLASAKQVLASAKQVLVHPPPPPPPLLQQHNTNTNPLPPSAVGDDVFSTFWQAYPRKTNKTGAAKAFARLHPDDDLLATILAAVARQSTSDQWTRDSGQFIPHAATWLNQLRWEDEDTPPPAYDRFAAGAI